jgi:hypothetical protein
MNRTLVLQSLLRAALVAMIHGASIHSFGRAGTLDQAFFVDPPSAANTVSNTQDLAQTFTVGITGLLDRIDVQVGRDADPTGPLVVQLRKTLPSGFPGDTPADLLAEVTLDESSIPTVTFATTFTQVDLGGQSFPVIAGEVYAIALRSTTTGNSGRRYLWASDSPDQYAGGRAYVRGILTGGVYQTGNPVERGFRTYVVPIPEPSALTLALGAVAAVACRLRQRCR